MVGFGEHLRRERNDDWAQDYLEFDMLKKKLGEVLEQQAAGNAPVAQAMRTILQGLFDQQIEKVLAAYARHAAELETGVARAKEECERVLREVGGPEAGLSADEKVRRVDACIVLLREKALAITNLMSFVSLNMAAIRKILKKISKNIDTDGPRGPGLLTLRVEHPHEPGWRVLQGTYLPAKIGLDLEEMQRHQVLQELGVQVRQLYERLHARHDALRSEHADLTGQEPVATPALSRAISRNLQSMRSWKYAPPPLRSLRTRGGSEDVIRQMDALLEAMQQAAALAASQARLVHALTWGEAQAGLWEPPPEDSQAVADFNGLLLNCVNSGLYMANYNLVIPTVTALCTHIGAGQSVVGIVIGCCDMATIVGTLGYSVWTNTNYKAPMLVSALACIAGNLAYCLSYDLRSLPLLVLARLITGFGSARAVNRRYIAMYVARKDRTNASALFVSLSAVGMALGPLLALPLSRMPQFELGVVTVGPITAGGYVVSLAWLAYLGWAATFKDPLKVLAAREAAAERGSGGDLEQPLLANGDGAEPGTETGKAAPKPHEAASSLDLASTAEGSTAAEQPAGERPGWRQWLATSPLVPTALCIFLCFILKVVQQAYIDGLPIFTLGLYGWSSGQVGILIGVLGLVAPVVNTAVGAFSKKVPDRHITAASILLTGIGAAALMRGAFPQWNFFAAGAALFVGTIVLEGISMSLTSKVIDESIASGLFNAGMLSTQAGTIGRLCGNLLLSLCVSITGAATAAQIGRLAGTLFGSALACMAVSLLLTLAIYRRLIC